MFVVLGAQTYTVKIKRDPGGTLVDGQHNTFDYPILTSLILTCVVLSSDSSQVVANSYHWNTAGCYKHAAYNSGNSKCFPHGKKTHSVRENDLRAEDAGTITCIATIDKVEYESDPLTIRISGNKE